MNKLLGSYLRRFYIFFCWLCVMFSSPVFLFAREDEPKKEPIWVMSWATFILFVAIMIFLLAHSSLRPNTALSNAEQKEIEEDKAQQVAKRKKAEGNSRLKAKPTSRLKH